MPGNTNMSIRVDSELKHQAEQILSQFPQHEFLLDLTRELLCREK